MKFATEGPVVLLRRSRRAFVYFGSYDSKFYAPDAGSGQLKRKFETAGEHRYAGRHLHGLLPAGESMPDPWDYLLSSPAEWKGTVYFGGHDSNVYALDAKTGKQKWVYSTKGSWVNNSAAVYEGKLFLGTSIPGLMHAVDSETGAQVFTLDTRFPVFASIANSNGALYFGALDG